MVAAVGFKGRTLEIPKDLNPQVAALIESCSAKYLLLFSSYFFYNFLYEVNHKLITLLLCHYSETWRRPSFADIMESLKPFIKAPVPLIV